MAGVTIEKRLEMTIQSTNLKKGSRATKEIAFDH